MSRRDEWQFDGARGRAGATHMPICLCCGEDVDLEQDYNPVLPFCRHCVSARCRKCRTWVRVRRFEQDPTFNLIGRPPRAADEMRLELRRSAHGESDATAFHHVREAADSLRPRGATTGTLKVKRGRPPGPQMLCGWRAEPSQSGADAGAVNFPMPRESGAKCFLIE
jgi:hypothetical protein